mmetsp:Transcript_26166/g.57172  ORF Transcript_26166/g.57172 Transcript_26166/m.57172 type:complete len:290 (+) Transcript_26166:294-1163(+)|eukprot:CAMPEP_0202910854 /NCGR_PEP_ID=MMETSP1392-20130828/53228_1 /ASSEMBLY_ACC=CAM_ASM_000868 /TAXON_ID=225041 /ORGANISM="Chlamydomonas chlamydogama, Strain SAG 11-48b" /LENGTH=289 /DNA_ID=CAMNT_0049601121 /DNA_START=217 /DNA_END=1086 /DNA_ORIENTATION=+
MTANKFLSASRKLMSLLRQSSLDDRQDIEVSSNETVKSAPEPTCQQRPWAFNWSQTASGLFTKAYAVIPLTQKRGKDDGLPVSTCGTSVSRLGTDLCMTGLKSVSRTAHEVAEKLAHSTYWKQEDQLPTHCTPLNATTSSSPEFQEKACTAVTLAIPHVKPVSAPSAPSSVSASCLQGMSACNSLIEPVARQKRVASDAGSAGGCAWPTEQASHNGAPSSPATSCSSRVSRASSPASSLSCSVAFRPMPKRARTTHMTSVWHGAHPLVQPQSCASPQPDLLRAPAALLV